MRDKLLVYDLKRTVIAREQFLTFSLYVSSESSLASAWYLNEMNR